MLHYPLKREYRNVDFGKSMLMAKAVSNPPTIIVAKSARLKVPAGLPGMDVGIMVTAIPIKSAPSAIHWFSLSPPLNLV